MSEHALKGRGLFSSSLRKIQKQVQPTLAIDHEAIIYLEDLIIQLLYQLCSSNPHTLIDVEEKIDKAFPSQIRGWAIESANAALEKGKKKALAFSVDKLQSYAQKEVLGYKIDYPVAVYIVAVLDYIAADILKLAGNYVKNIRHSEITTQDIKVAMLADKVLMSMFHNEDIESAIEPILQPLSKRDSLVYIEVLKDFMLAEEQYIRELNLIIKVFYEPMQQATEFFTDEDLELIFSNILDIFEVTVQFYAMIENTCEMVDDNSGTEPLIGDCFEEIAEAAELECYDTYVYDQVGYDQDEGICKTYVSCREMLKKDDLKEFFHKKGLFDSVKYILPKLLYLPIYHCADYFEYIRLLVGTSPDGADREKLDEALSAFRGLQLKIEKICSVPPLKRTPEDKVFYQRSMGTAVPNSSSKIETIQSSIEGWEGKDISQISSLLLKEGMLVKVANDGKKVTERKVFLFDNLMVCTKQNSRHLGGFSQAEYRLKEKIFLRKAEIHDVPDTSDIRHAFEITQPNIQPIIFSCPDDQIKFEWMSFLMTLQHRSTLDRMLDAILQDEEQSIQLYTPEPSVYLFAEEDDESNIVYEKTSDMEDSGEAIVKGGTLYKLIERLTYHKYADPTFIRVFLTTYRSFSNPVELLDLLIKRYDIPEPLTSEKNGNFISREELKRFRKEYVHPIQLRVLNVLRHWVDQHFYDFQREESLLSTLRKFLSRVVRSKTARKWVETIEKIVNRRLDTSVSTETYSFSTTPPQIEWHLATTFEKFNLLTLSPLELGRQITIIQAETFRAIKPSELVGVKWIGPNKYKDSPNTTKMSNFSTTLTFWYMKNVCETTNFEERVAVYSRIVDILMVFIELNNFHGMMEVLGALNSSPVHRLKMTSSELTPKRKEALQEVLDLTDDGHNIKYKEKLRSINPPCVPFVGMYLSNILKAEEGNPDYLPQKEGCRRLINFSKRRMVANITGEIQNYQNMPYNLKPQPLIRQYLEQLEPLDGRTEKEMNDYLYDLSLQIEPRHAKQPTKFPRKFDISLKSPGIKPTQRPSVSGGRKSVSQEPFEHSNSLSSHEKKPPSPSVSSNPTLTPSFSIIEDDEPDGPPIEEKFIPPPPLPRVPAYGEKAPVIPERRPSSSTSTVTSYSYTSRTTTYSINRSASIDERRNTPPPAVPPRQAKTPGFMNTPVFDLPPRPIETPPLPKRSSELTDRSRSASEISTPPSLPPRSVKPNYKQRYSDSNLTQTKNRNKLPALPSRKPPPELPPLSTPKYV